MKGGVILFRGSGAAARAYIEADRSRADEYYLGADQVVAEYTVIDATGEVTASRSLTADKYEGWVDWVNPETGESMGIPRKAGTARKGSPLFAEMVINAPKSLSVAAALHSEVSEALDVAQRDAAREIQRFLGQHSVTLAGPRGAQEVLPVGHMQTVAISHKTSRAGDPHRHIHFQIGTRVFAGGKWRALTTAALFQQQGAIRALGTAVIAAHPQLAATLADHGPTLDPVSGEVVELEPFNAVMSKRSAQIRRNLERMEAEWEQEHPGESPGPVLTARMQDAAWAFQRPGKKPANLKDEQWWQQELTEAGYDPEHLQSRPVAPVSLNDLSVQQVASRALDRCTAAASTWTPHTVREHVTRITTEAGVQATPAQLREFIDLAAGLAISDCFSVLPPGMVQPEHVAHLTSLDVLAAETELRDQLTASTPKSEPKHPDMTEAAQAAGLDAGQTVAATAVASTDPLVIVEGAAGSGKTTMLGVAIKVAADEGRLSRVVTPTLRAAQAATEELGVPATSVAALVYAHGWRWNAGGVWTRLQPGQTDPETGATYQGPPRDAVLTSGERVIVDEAGMLDQNTTLALLTVTVEAGASVALVGDRAQLPAVGRGGVLDMAAKIRGITYDMAELHRFTDPDYAQLTLTMRDCENPGAVFDQLAAMGFVTIHDSEEDAQAAITETAEFGEAITVATNDDAAELNERIRTGRVERGEVDDTATTVGSDGLRIGAGDLIQTRKNSTRLGVANRQQWIVQHVTNDGTIYAREVSGGRVKHQRTVALPADYVGEHAHLSYAATAYGVQGATVDNSHTVLSDSTSAAGVYVGMTRGRQQNQLHIVADDMADARAQFASAMERDAADRGLDHATARAIDAVQGLISDGPVQLVTDELARLTAEAESTERAAERWEQTANRFDAQRATHGVEDDEQADVLRRAEGEAERIRSEVIEPLTVQAAAEGTTYLDAVETEAKTSAKLSTVRRFGRRKARAEHRTAIERTRTVRARVRETWGEPPRTTEALPEWAAEVAARPAEADPRVIDAAQHVEVARADRDAMRQRHEQEHRALLASEYGPQAVTRYQVGMRLPNPTQQAVQAKEQAARLRQEADELRNLPVKTAARRIEAKRAEQEQQRRQATERERQLSDPFEHDQHRSHSRHDGPTRGL